MSIRGAIDRLDAEGAAGWIYWAGAKGPVAVEAVLLGRIIGEAVADRNRPDLAAVGFGDGNCGFEIRFYDEISAHLIPLVSVRPQGGDVELPRTNLTGFPEYFRSVQARFPNAGRQRSVFGGLWIDRTDAVSLLEGKVAVGGTDASLAEPLRRLITDGHILLKGALAPAGFSAADLKLAGELPDGVVDPAGSGSASAFLEAIPTVLFREGAIRVLRAALEDNPLACRTTLTSGRSGGFSQPSTAEVLPSPGEMLLLVTTLGEGRCEVDIVAGSNTLPEFTSDGQSRYVSPSAAAAIELAVNNGASVDTIDVGPLDVVVIGPGTLNRIRSAGPARALAVWCVPARQTPTFFLKRQEAFRVKHFSGAALVA